ncbi:unnamed protein product [Spirodela intermedia]|uniref:Uncharacterized protein n=1 Tax=Spirodela intermedia TaxID=51605 RepID=A0A7I8JW20_SPIIN|nr:unnamed protein product [Spirodela intermedia]
MLSSSSLHLLAPPPHRYPAAVGYGKAAGRRSRVRAGTSREENPGALSPSPAAPPSSSLSQHRVPRRSISLAGSAALLLWSLPACAGVLSGFPGLESVPGPELPQIDFLNRWNEEKRKKYEELDSRFRSSSVLKELLEKSKQNKDRNKRAIQDKYCIRGAEWGVGDCSTDGMTQDEKDAFIKELKKRSGVE